MSCDEFGAQYLAGAITSSPHLAGCAACRASLEGLDRIRASLADPDMWEQPGPLLEARVVAEIRRDQEPPLARRRRLGWIVAAAAVVAAVVGVGTWHPPDWTETLVATDQAPLAHATVNGWLAESGTTNMRFDVGGLAPAGEGAYYEVWLSAVDGRHVSGGTFSGSGTIETSIGVTRADYPRVWITLEPADNDLGPSLVVVLDNPGY